MTMVMRRFYKDCDGAWQQVACVWQPLSTTHMLFVIGTTPGKWVVDDICDLDDGHRLQSTVSIHLHTLLNNRMLDK